MRSKFLNPNHEDNLISSINVTSLVDVTLVILIIFILIAPIMEQGISLTLPKATSAKIKSKDALIIEVDKNGRLFLDSMQVGLPDFINRLKGIASFNPDQAILIRADQDNKYGDIVQIIDIIKNSGLNKIGILTRQKEKI